MLNSILNLNQRGKRVIFITIDLALVPMCFLLTVLLQNGRMIDPHQITDQWALILTLTGSGALLSHAIGIYRIKLKSFERHAIRRMLLASISLAVCSFMLQLTNHLPLRHHALFGMIHFLCLITSRAVLLEILLTLYRRADATEKLVIYGAGQTGTQLVSALRSQPGVTLVGFMDDNPTLAGQIIHGLTVHHGALLEQVAATTKPDRVIIAMPSTDRAIVSRLERRVKQLGIACRSIPSFAQILGDDAKPVAADLFLGRDHIARPTTGDPSFYADKTVLVTGAGGTIGSELCRQLIDMKPAVIILLDHSEFALYTIEAELREAGCDAKIHPVLGTVCDRSFLTGLMNAHRIDLILHAAAYKHVPLVEQNAQAGLSNNVLGTLTLAQAASAAGVQHFVLISSDKAVEPASIMGLSKYLSEQVIRDLAARLPATTFAIVRFGNVLGSSGSVIPMFQNQVARGGPVTLTDPRVTRYFMTVQEAVQLVLTAATLSDDSDTFVLDMGDPVSILTLARSVIERSGLTVCDALHPEGQIKIVTTGLRSGEKLHEKLTCGQRQPVAGHDKLWRVREPQLSEFEIARLIKAIETGDLETVTRSTQPGALDRHSPPDAPVRRY